MSELIEYLKSVSPSFAFYGVLMTFAYVSFAVFKYFWSYEKELKNENMEYLKELVTSFREKYIEPFLKKSLKETTKGGYKLAIKELQADIYVQESGATTLTLIADNDALRRLLSTDLLNDRYERKMSSRDALDEYFISSSGEDFFDELEHLYDQQMAYKESYNQAGNICARISYTAIFLAFMFLIAISNIYFLFSDYVKMFWFFLIIQALIYAGYSFVMLEVHRRKLKKLWENFRLYGKI